VILVVFGLVMGALGTASAVLLMHQRTLVRQVQTLQHEIDALSQSAFEVKEQRNSLRRDLRYLRSVYEDKSIPLPEPEEPEREPKEPKRRPLKGAKPSLGCSMSIRTTPWAAVWIDGKNAHLHTPLLDFKVPCGKHKLAFKRSDMHIDHSEIITVRPGQSFKQHYTLATDD
jgi:hypothetical protein